jgi:hypothetical protein
MLWITAVILFTFWLVGVSVSYTFGGYLHILVGIALTVMVLQLIRSRIDSARRKQPISGASRSTAVDAASQAIVSRKAA